MTEIDKINTNMKHIDSKVDKLQHQVRNLEDAQSESKKNLQ